MFVDKGERCTLNSRGSEGFGDLCGGSHLCQVGGAAVRRKKNKNDKEKLKREVQEVVVSGGGRSIRPAAAASRERHGFGKGENLE